MMDNPISDFGSYPAAPGHRDVDTSVAAANDIAPNAGTLRAKVLVAIRNAGKRGLTTNECAAALEIQRDSIQPRTSELRAAGLIVDSGERRPNANGKRVIVWAVVDPPNAAAA